MSIRDWLPQPGRVRELRRLAERGEYVLGRLPRLVAQQLDEQYWTSRDMDIMVRHQSDVMLSGAQTGLGGTPDDGQRLASVAQCRHLYFYDPLFSRIINLWTDFGFGQTMQVVAEDQAAQDAFDEYWGAKRNAKIIGPQRRHILSNRLLVDGEIYWLWFVDEKTGLSTVRFMYTDQVTALINPAGDPWVTCYYARQWQPNPRSMTTETWWYQDKDATPEDLEKIGEEQARGQVKLASEQEEGTAVYASQFEYPTLGQRGWPLMTAGADWSTSYKTFAEDRTALTRAAAMFYRKLQVKGGTRDVAIATNKFASGLTQYGTYTDNNPPPAPGSTLIMNTEAEEQQTPYNTGASDADKDGAMLIAMAGIAAGVFPHYLGRGDAFRLATATAMEGPMYRMWTRYQQLWEEELLEHFNFVLDMRERYARERYPIREASVTMDPLREQDIAQTTAAIGQAFDRGLIPPEVASKLALEAFQVADIDVILDQMFPETETAEQRVSNLRVLGDLFREAAEGNGDGKVAAEVGLDQVQSMLRRMGATP